MGIYIRLHLRIWYLETALRMEGMKGK